MDGDVAGVVTRSGFLFERRLVLFVEYDQTEMRRRREDGAASADDHFDFALGDASPVFVAFDVAQVAVQNGDAIEASAEAADSLRCEADFGHEQNGLPAEADDIFDRLDVNFGF